jgi:lipopolysaccharide export system ATP-binding protein
LKNQSAITITTKSESINVTLKAVHLHKKYGGRPVVNDVSFDVHPGEIVGLLGPNGAGKTTSFYAVAGVIQPDQGEIWVNDNNISALPIHERARRGVGYLPQETSVFRQLSVEDNIQLVQEFQSGSAELKKRELNQLLEEFGLTRHRHAIAIQLSGGERRRVEIARAIAARPQFLMLDEPFTGIDPIAIQDIQKLVVQLKSRGLGILLTDHNPKATLSIVDRAYIIHDGKIIFSGSAQEASLDPMVKKYYLGEQFNLEQ